MAPRGSAILISDFFHGVAKRVELATERFFADAGPAGAAAPGQIIHGDGQSRRGVKGVEPGPSRFIHKTCP